MLDRMLLAIHNVRPNMTVRTRTIVEAIVLSEGSIGSAEHVSHRLGLKNRFRLARLLKNEGLPPLHRLTEWASVLGWIDKAEKKGVSLCWLAFRCHRHSSACYRLVKKLTGEGWANVHARGGTWVLRHFLKELERRASRV
jgi:hypothetical protein